MGGACERTAQQSEAGIWETEASSMLELQQWGMQLWELGHASSCMYVCEMWGKPPQDSTGLRRARQLDVWIFPLRLSEGRMPPRPPPGHSTLVWNVSRHKKEMEAEVKEYWTKDLTQLSNDIFVRSTAAYREEG